MRRGSVCPLDGWLVLKAVLLELELLQLELELESCVAGVASSTGGSTGHVNRCMESFLTTCCQSVVPTQMENATVEDVVVMGAYKCATLYSRSSHGLHS